eukprot:scaffold74554_cov63-Phaeocystis_antarctica.AAC.1
MSASAQLTTSTTVDRVFVKRTRPGHGCSFGTAPSRASERRETPRDTRRTTLHLKPYIRCKKDQTRPRGPARSRAARERRVLASPRVARGRATARGHRGG